VLPTGQSIAADSATTFAWVDRTALTHAHPANSVGESSKGTMRTRRRGDMDEHVASVGEHAQHASRLSSPPEVEGVTEQWTFVKAGNGSPCALSRPRVSAPGEECAMQRPTPNVRADPVFESALTVTQ